jgi:hypothetical protein
MIDRSEKPIFQLLIERLLLASSNRNNFGSALHSFAAARLELKQFPPQQRA